MHMLLTCSFMISYNLFLEISQIVSNEPTAKVTSLPYDRWLSLWKERLSMVPDLPVVPPPACKINTPLNTKIGNIAYPHIPTITLYNTS